MASLKRGDLVTYVSAGDYGKPRPGLVVQSDSFTALPAVTLLPITSQLRDVPLLRIPIQPSAANGLQCDSEVMVDKITTIRRDKVGKVFGVAATQIMRDVTVAMRRFLETA
jgi:mRNA interferase MazF